MKTLDELLDEPRVIEWDDGSQSIKSIRWLLEWHDYMAAGGFDFINLARPKWKFTSLVIRDLLTKVAANRD